MGNMWKQYGDFMVKREEDQYTVLWEGVKMMVIGNVRSALKMLEGTDIWSLCLDRHIWGPDFYLEVLN